MSKRKQERSGAISGVLAGVVLAFFAAIGTACATAIPSTPVSEMSKAELQQEFDRLSWDLHQVSVGFDGVGSYADRSESWLRNRHASLVVRRQQVRAALGGDVFDPLGGGLATKRIDCELGQPLDECASKAEEQREDSK